MAGSRTDRPLQSVRTQNRIPLLLIASFQLARDQTQNWIPLLLIALGC